MKRSVGMIALMLVAASCGNAGKQHSHTDTTKYRTGEPPPLLARPGGPPPTYIETSSADNPDTDPVRSTFISATDVYYPLYLTAIHNSETQKEIIFGVADKSEPMNSRYELITLDVDYAGGRVKVLSQDKQSYGADATHIELIAPFEQTALKAFHPVIYFATKDNPYGSGAAGSASLRFNLFSLKTHLLYTLEFDGEETEDGRVEGNFTNLNDFAYFREELQFLMRRADTCRYIRRPEEVDIEAPAQFAKKWKAVNPDVPDVFGAQDGEEGSLTFPAYASELMPFTEASKVLENEQFEIADFFRGSVIARDKHSGQYFPVWVEGCNHGCEKEISFTEAGKLKIAYASGGVTVVIDLKQPGFAITK